MNALEAYDWLRIVEPLKSRLETVAAELDGKKNAKRERGWLEQAVELLTTERHAAAELATRARNLPDLIDIASEDASEFQERWVDALEKLLAGITFHAGSRAPIIESLFPHVKLAPLRRAKKEVAFDFWKEFERRLKSGYVSRMLADSDFAFAQPVIESLQQAHAQWMNALEPKPLEESQAATVREQLLDAGARAERVCRQAKLLAEAALVPFEQLVEQAGLNLKPKRRAPRPVDAAPEAEPQPEPAAPEPEADEKPRAKKGRAKAG